MSLKRILLTGLKTTQAVASIDQQLRRRKGSYTIQLVLASTAAIYTLGGSVAVKTCQPDL
jgi:hypothetical protein